MKINLHDSILERRPMLQNEKDFSEVDVISKFKDLSIFREAVYLASRDFYKDVESRILTNNVEEKTISTLLKYYVRMNTRSTPFGLFSNVSLNNWNRDKISDRTKGISNKRKIRLDSVILTGIINYIKSLELIENQLYYCKNNTIYRAGNRIKYINKVNTNISYKTYILEKAKSNDVLDFILHTFAEDCFSKGQIVKKLIELGYTELESSQYFNTLVKEGLIIATFQYHLIQNEADNLKNIVLFLQNLKEKNADLEKLISILSNISTRIDAIENQEIEDGKENIGAYETIISLIHTLPINWRMVKNFIQVDVISEPQISMPPGTKKLITEGIEVIRKVSNFQNFRFQEFKNRFVERYGYSAVPLNEVLDPEIGIGYPFVTTTSSWGNLVAQAQTNSEIKLNDIESFLLRKVLRQGKSSGDHSIILTDEDINILSKFNDKTKFSPTFSIQFQYKETEGNPFLYIKGFQNKSAGNMISRFSHCHEGIKSLVSEICAKEQEYHNGKITAEVVHYPAMERLGNVMTRTHSRPYEIPYVNLGSEKSKQINIEDLVLKYQDEEIKLFSKKLGKEILPFHTSAHNYSFDSLPLYKLLCDLGVQNSQIGFNWGNLSLILEDFPRISYKNLILSPKTWIIDFSKASRNDVKSILVEKGIHEKFLLCEGDNEILMGIDEPTSLAFLEKFRKKKSTIHLKEYFFEDSECYMPHELQANGHLAKPHSDLIHRKIDLQLNNEPYQIGSNWVYYKFYCHQANSNLLIKDTVGKIVDNLYSKNLVENWFYIRYGDPSHHIRLRIKTKYPEKVIKEIFKTAFVKGSRNQILKTQMEPYIQEIERYGIHTMAEAEILFGIESQFAMELIKIDLKESNLFALVISLVDHYLSIFEKRNDQKLIFCQRMKDYYNKEFILSKESKETINLEFKNRLKDILIRGYSHSDLVDQKLIEPFKIKSREQLEKLLSLSDTESSGSKFVLLNSLIHMLINRIIAGAPRSQEFIIYDTLVRYYTSQKYIQHA